MNRILQLTKLGLKSFLSVITFFYSRPSLILLSLIPSSIRAFQMWSENAPIWLEAIVAMSRIFLFLLMIALMARVSINDLLKKPFWESFSQLCSRQFKSNWPDVFMGQLMAFIILLYGLGNGLVILLSHGFLVVIDLFTQRLTNDDALYHAFVYFLKNMSVIPLALVFVLYMCGARPHHDSDS